MKESEEKRNQNSNEVETYDKPAVRSSLYVMGTRYPFLYLPLAILFIGNYQRDKKLEFRGREFCEQVSIA